ncbi:MAG: AAA family ATPase, partial [Phycisphaerae bacterium]|nr:AAA family ATPase [Phycisphaerae bacterium]
MTSLKKLTLKGFKSIESLVDFEFRSVNVLIGANGAGKSNLVDFFRMLRAMANRSLQRFVVERGEADSFFYMGPKRTSRISAEIEFGGGSYEFELAAGASGSLVVADESASVDNFGIGIRRFDPEPLLGDSDWPPPNDG